VLGWCVCMQRGKEGGEGSEKGDVGSSSRVQNVRANNQNLVQKDVATTRKCLWGKEDGFPLTLVCGPVCVCSSKERHVMMNERKGNDRANQEKKTEKPLA